MKLGLMNWRTLPKRIVKGWNKREELLNRLQITGRFTLMPHEIDDALIDDALEYLTFS